MDQCGEGNNPAYSRLSYFPLFAKNRRKGRATGLERFLVESVENWKTSLPDFPAYIFTS
jgi:hypothetical protein